MVSGAYTCNKRDHVIGHGKSSQKILYNLVLGYLGLLKDVFCKELIYQHYKELIYQQGNNNRKWLVQAWQFSHLFATQHFSLLSLICRSRVILDMSTKFPTFVCPSDFATLVFRKHLFNTFHHCLTPKR